MTTLDHDLRLSRAAAQRGRALVSRLVLCATLASSIMLLPALVGPLPAAETKIQPRAAAESEQTQALRAKVQEYIDQGMISGAVVATGTSKGIYNIVSVGVRDLGTEQPMEVNTFFRIASMTKPMTALGIMILIDEGKLSIDDEVEKYLPEFQGQMLVESREKDRVVLVKPSRKITIKDLLTHTSGLGPAPPGLKDLYQKRDRTLAEGVMAFSQQPLVFEPGTKWAYCNQGIDTLGRIIEVVSGQAYEDFLKARIFDPVGMKRTYFFPHPGVLDLLATLYEENDGELVPSSKAIIDYGVKMRYPLPAGGLISCAPDLANFCEMMLGRGEIHGRRVVSTKRWELMTSVHTGDLEPGFVPGMGFGLGVGVVREPQGVTAMLSPGSFGHGGAFGTQYWMDPKQDLFVILLIQRTGIKNSDGSDLRRDIQQIAVDTMPSE
ncbi:MAG: serine hydrolase domain-containing protein [Planctomycetota bacterium]